jgi:hypothetical protein
VDAYADDEAGTFFGLHHPFANSSSLSSHAAAPPACAQLLRADVARMQALALHEFAAAVGAGGGGAAGVNSGANSAAQAARRAASQALDALVGEMSENTYSSID